MGRINGAGKNATEKVTELKNMRIIKEGGTVDKIILSFRYKFDQKELCDLVANELRALNIPFELHEPSKFANTFRIIFDEIQDDYFDPKLIVEINKKFKIPNECYDFFLGITSRYSIGGFSVPQNVIKSICLIGGEVEISYAT